MTKPMTGRIGRFPKQFSQATRLIRMIRALGSRAMTTSELAQEFGITPRQIYRDRKQIEASGIPLVSDESLGEQSWRIDPAYKWLPPLPPTPSELMSLHLAKSHLTYLKGTPFTDDLENLSQKIEATLPSKTVNHLDRIVRVFFPLQRPLRSYDKHKTVLLALQKSLLLQRPITIKHRTGGYERAVIHKVAPYGLLLYDHGLYLVGYSHRERALRMFAVERMTQAIVNMEDGPVKIPADWSLHGKFRHSFGLVAEPVLNIRIRVSRQVAHFFKERRWHPTQRHKTVRNGELIVSFQAGGLEEITSWVLSWGAHLVVLSPSELIESVTAQLTATRRSYSRWPRKPIL